MLKTCVAWKLTSGHLQGTESTPSLASAGFMTTVPQDAGGCKFLADACGLTVLLLSVLKWKPVCM